jgi:catechol 2,3-dioxygenase-like lactoylglutathione lyase family enzyme
MLATSKLIAFAATADGARARRFYEGTLGLRVLSDDSFALTIAANGTMLRIQKVGSFTPAAYTTLGWQVPDILLAVRDLKRREVRLEFYPGMAQDELGIWHSPSGASVVWFKDPDGNILSVTQF